MTGASKKEMRWRKRGNTLPGTRGELKSLFLIFSRNECLVPNRSPVLRRETRMENGEKFERPQEAAARRGSGVDGIMRDILAQLFWFEKRRIRNAHHACRGRA
jgi:hypothetical protein